MNSIITNGLVHVYTGDGKGKTTAALGQALRASGYGLKCLMAQFLKHKDDTSGELKSAPMLAPYLTIIRLKQRHPFFSHNPHSHPDTLQSSVDELFTIAKKAILEHTYDLVILDEINNSIQEGLLRIDDVVNLMKNKPRSLELILTGRNALPEIIKKADLVTEMKKIKHPFDLGIPARIGIEY
ncbi:MAG: cob(I)yrinic acid a,c-diamide adenosyltransferase [bacterium]